MGLFDTLRCEMRLPVKDDSVLRKQEYQTKDVGAWETHGYCTLLVITKDGELTVKGSKVDFTGSVNFYTDSVNGVGGWIEFCALVSDGRVLEISAVELPNRFQNKGKSWPPNRQTIAKRN